MILQLLQFLLISIIGNKNEPVHSLHKKQEPVNLKGLNWTFILLLALVILFFISIWIFQIGNSYPNDLMNGSLNV